MKRFLFIVVPLLIAFALFGIIMFFLTRNKEKGALQVTSAPDSKVYLNGNLIGQTPLCKCQLKDMLQEGTYTVQLVPVKGDFQPFEQKIIISSKVLTVVDRTFSKEGLATGSVISLAPIDDKTDAQISVISFPKDAKVFLDNNLQGQSPILLKKITVSDHELKLSKDGYKDKIVRIRTVLGYKLEALIFLGINPEVATASAAPIASKSAVSPQANKILILTTPTGFLRVRASSSLAGAEIAQVKPGETYQLLSEKTGWYEIKLTNGKSGWISSTYAQKQN